MAASGREEREERDEASSATLRELIEHLRSFDHTELVMKLLAGLKEHLPDQYAYVMKHYKERQKKFDETVAKIGEMKVPKELIPDKLKDLTPAEALIVIEEMMPTSAHSLIKEED